MADVIDPRIVRFGIEINGALKMYDGLAITALGVKYANANQNECEIKVTNMNQETRNAILTETSPFNKNRTPKLMVLDVGRVSYGTTRIFAGDVTSVTMGQPPDITMQLKSLTKNFAKGNVISAQQPGRVSLSQAAGAIAKGLDLNLDFQASDKYISNHSFNGASLKQVEKLGAAGNVNAFIDDQSLVVKDTNVTLKGQIRELDLDSGMIGIPEVSEQGVKITFFIDNQTRVGSGIQLTSVLYPTLNGTYIIYKLGFAIASRDTPFYYQASCKRIVS